MRQAYIFLILISFSSYGQINKTRLINPQTNSYFFYAATHHDVKRQRTINYFYLISSNGDKTNKERINVNSDEKTKLYIDSLKKNGFEKFAKTTNLTNKCKFNMTLNSMDIYRIDRADTIFSFALLINLSKANGQSIYASDTIRGDKKQEILDAIQNKKYTVTVKKINKTNLLDVFIESFVLTNPNKYNIFSAGSGYSIYLVDKN
jgi:hypothetical protein